MSPIVILTPVLVFEDGIHGLQQRPQKAVVGIVNQKKRRRGHGVEQQHQLCARCGTEPLKVVGDVVDHS